jgi:hypothetical protein
VPPLTLQNQQLIDSEREPIPTDPPKSPYRKIVGVIFSLH